MPIRHARMMVSPFTFYRGAALIMAADLAGTPISGITMQICGDAHLSNFGVFGTPERRLVFDINDFDETLPGPWEWDVKRLAASFEVAGRHRGFTDAERREITLTVVRGYRERMLRAAESRVLEAWYDRLDADRFLACLDGGTEAEPARRQAGEAHRGALAKARTNDSMRAVSKLAEVVDGSCASPPTRRSSCRSRTSPRSGARARGRGLDAGAAARLPDDPPAASHPMQEFSYVHMARKVVGVGSVGTRAWIVLLRGRDDADPLLLQAKQAQASVLERFLPPSEYDDHGERVVRGQRLMQAASDLFLGWHRRPGSTASTATSTCGSCTTGRAPPTSRRWCRRAPACTRACAARRSRGRTPVRATASRSRRTSAHADRFDQAIAEFARDYADQNDRDYAAFVEAVQSGRLEAAASV